MSTTLLTVVYKLLLFNDYKVDDIEYAGKQYRRVSQRRKDKFYS